MNTKQTNKPAGHRAYDRIQAAIAAVPVDDATPAEVGEAAVSAALDLLRALTDDRTAVRSLMSRAEVLIKKGRDENPAPSSDTATAHAVLTTASESLIAMGYEPYKVCELLIIFGVSWIDRTLGREVAAGTLYGVADNLAAPKGKARGTAH